MTHLHTPTAHTHNHTTAPHTFFPAHILAKLHSSRDVLRSTRCLENAVMMLRVLVCVLAVIVCLVSADPPVALDKDSFAEAIDSGKPYFVKFYAPW